MKLNKRHTIIIIRKILLLVLTCSSIGCIHDLRAQTYPVWVDALPPSFGSATVYLGDFAHLKATGMRINFQVELRDPVELFRQVHFRLHVIRNGTTVMMTDPSILPPIITLQKDIPIMVSGVDLAFYFDLNHLVSVSGTSLNNVLPEDYYSICIEVVDFVRQEVISEQVCASGFLEQLEPPLLYFPQQGMPLSIGQSVNLMFNWQLTGTGISKMMQPNISYIFELRELTPGLENVQEYFENNTLVYQEEVTNNSFIYGVALPALVQDKRYIWRVRALARDENGAELVGYFHNNGISEIWDFTLPDEVRDNDFCNATIPQLPKNQNPITQILVDDVIHVGHFDLLVTELQNASGDAAKGTGIVLIPFLDIQFETEFDNLKVNAKHEAFDGRVQTIRSDNWAKRIAGKQDGSLDFSQTGPISDDEVNQLILGARAINEDSPNRLPMSFMEQLQDRFNIEMPHDLVISELWFTPFGAALNAFMLVPNGNGDFARFGVSNVGIDHSGFDISDLKLFLCEHTTMPGFDDDVIDIIASPGQVREDKGSFLSFDCSGFKSYNLQGSYQFDKEMLVRASNLSVPASAMIHIQSEKWGRVLASVMMQDFAIPGMDDWRFEVLNGFVDFSSEENVQHMTLPSNYVVSDDKWRGFYISDVKVSLPHELKFGSNNTLEMLARHLVIDHEGVFFSGMGANVLSLGTGNAGGWGLSFDQLQLNIAQNEFTDADIVGQVIAVPISDTIQYNGRIFREGEAGEYALDLFPKEEVAIPFLNARIEPDKESVISIRHEPPFCVAEWRPYTDINGPLLVVMNEASFSEFGEDDIRIKMDQVKDSIQSNSTFDFELSGVELKGFKVNHPKLPDGRFFGIDRASVTNSGVSLADINLSVEGVDLLEESFELNGDQPGLGLGFHIALGNFGIHPKFWALNQNEKEAGPYTLAKIEMEIPDVPKQAFACACNHESTESTKPNYCQPPVSRLSESTLQEGAVLQVGHFLMRVTSLAGNQGTGLISVPFLGNQLEVDFEGLEISPDGMVTGGTVQSAFSRAFSSIREEALQPMQSEFVMQSIVDDISFFNQIRNQKPNASGNYSCPVSLTPFVHDLIPTAYEEQFEFVFMGARFASEGAKVNCMVFFKTPDGDVLKFGVAELDLRPDGFDLEDLKLYLAEEASIALGNGEVLKLNTHQADNPENSSYLSYSCDGFQAFHLKGIYTMDKAVLVSSDNRANPVEAFLEIETSVWGDYLGTVRMGSFAIPGLEDWSFEALEAGADFSDYSNLPAMDLPTGYGPLTPAWTGINVSRVKVNMPDALKLGGQDAISFDAENLLIDQYGISGMLTGYEVRSPNLKDNKRWKLSVNTIDILFIKNRFIEALPKGVLINPMLDFKIAFTGRIFKEPLSKSRPNQFYAMDLMPDAFILSGGTKLEIVTGHNYLVNLRKQALVNKFGQMVTVDGEQLFKYRPLIDNKGLAIGTLPKVPGIACQVKHALGWSNLLLNAIGITSWGSYSHEIVSAPATSGLYFGSKETDIYKRIKLTQRNGL